MNELVLGLRDTFSSEMREIRDRQRLAELNRIGDIRYIVKRTVQCTLLLEAVNAVIALSRVIAGRAPGQLFSADAKGFVIVGIIGLIAGGLLSSRDIVTLTAKYPDDVDPPV